MAIKNFDYCKYTYLHRKSLEYYIKNCKKLGNLEKKELLKRAKTHDMDKLTLYLFWQKKDASTFHRKNASHHIKNDILKQYSLEEFKQSYMNLHLDNFDEKKSIIPLDILIDVLESIFDYECAALTKPDKPLNAYDTCKNLYPELINMYEVVLDELGMKSSYNAITNDAIEYINQFNVNEDTIYMEVSKYLIENDDNIYIKLKSNMCSEIEYSNLTSYYDKYYFENFKKFFINYKEFDKIYISKEVIKNIDIPFLNTLNKKGKLIYLHNDINYFYFFVSIDGDINGKCFKDKQDLDISLKEYEF